MTSILFFSSQYKDQFQLLKQQQTMDQSREVVINMLIHEMKLEDLILLDGNAKYISFKKIIESKSKEQQLRFQLALSSLCLLQDTEERDRRIRELAISLK